MKKVTLLSTTALTVLLMAGQTMTAHAATPNFRNFSNGNTKVYTYQLGCTPQSLTDLLQNCMPGITLPDCNNSMDCNTPDINRPGNNDTSEHAFIQQVVNLVNEERAKEGLAPLTIDTKVQAAAMVRAKECEINFSHTRPDGRNFATALKEQNVFYRSSGENIAYGQQTPEAVMEAWMNSSGHRANIMNPNFTSIGVGYYENANGTDYWCQLFTR